MIAVQERKTASAQNPAAVDGGVKTFRLEVGEGADFVLVLRDALKICRAEGVERLVLPEGTHHLYPQFAGEKYLFISNNDEGLKRIAFDLEGFENLEIDGRGSLLIFHGFILPFVISRSANITVRNLRIDWDRTFHTEAIVVADGGSYLDLRIGEESPYRVEHGKLLLTGDDGYVYKITNALEFDVARRETAFKVYDNYDIGRHHRAEEVSPGVVRFFAEFKEPRPQVGNVFALIDEDRRCPGITISRSANILIEGVTIHHAGGMGFIGQLSSDVTLRHCAVKPPPNSRRMISTRADATHFVCCRGHILLEDCEFSHQLDDPGNFHNVYTPIVQRLSERSVIVRLKHFQQRGLEPYVPGHLVEFVKSASLEQDSGYELARVEVLNRDHTLLEFAESLPAHIGKDWAAGSLHWVADVTVRRTKVHSNRARGYLVTSGGKALFEENYFHSPGAAILIEGDADYWYEAGAVSDLVVRNNVFDNCNYGVWGRATIDINPQIKPEHRQAQRFHHNIRIEGNEFRTFHPEILKAHCVNGLAFRGNSIRFTNDYPCAEKLEPHLDWAHCSRVDISNNVVENEK